MSAMPLITTIQTNQAPQDPHPHPVSYTHLDVYKRQPRRRAKLRKEIIRTLYFAAPPESPLRQVCAGMRR